ncbi:MAG: hypothetical protein ACPGF7_09420 [Pontibacterium sp.]
MKLKPGDFVNVEDATSEQHDAIVNAFIAAGACKSESYSSTGCRIFIGWFKDDGCLYYSAGTRLFERELTTEQVLVKEWDGEGVHVKNEAGHVGVITSVSGDVIQLDSTITGWVRGDMVEPKEWDGEGVPPVGTVCECLSKYSWVSVEILGIHRDQVWLLKCDRAFTRNISDMKFRPTQAEKQKFVEKAKSFYTYGNKALVTEMLESMYDNGARFK